MAAFQVDRLTDTQAMAIALERVCRAANALLDAVARGDSIEKHIVPLEEALSASGQDSHTCMLWAQDVLDGKVPVRRKPQRRHETFDQLRKRAAAVNVFIHYVHTLEGSEYAIYKGPDKVAHAKTPERCCTLVRSLIKRAKG